MKIILIYPYFIQDRIHVEDIRAVPTGLYSVGALLKEAGFDVEIWNWHNINRTPDRIKDSLKAHRPDIIGFSILHANRWGGIEISRIARQLNPGVRIVFGGIGASFLWKHFLTHFPEIDAVVLGEGEYTFLDLAKSIEGGNRDFGAIKGIAFRKNGRIVKTKEADIIQSLDQLPIPARHFEYQHVVSSRGCAWKCAFCGSPQFWGQKARFRSPDHFVEELEILYQKGISFFYFSDDTFTIKKRRVIDICKKIIEKGLAISWYAISRVDAVDDDILYWMRRAGCIQISYGIESGSEKIRVALGKNLKTAEIKRAFSHTTKYGILSRAYFIYGSQGETWDTIQETIDLMHEIKPLEAIFYILDLFPGTGLYETIKKRTNLRDDVWLNRIEGIMYFETDSALSEELISAFGKRLRESFYENLAGYVDSLELIDREDLYETHADFYSRLAMTFSHGSYSKIQDHDDIAERLYGKSLSFHPNQRAYLGLGIFYQKAGRYKASMEVLSEGIGFFPTNEDLSVCLGISLMQTGEFEAALSYFSKFSDSKQAKHQMAMCRSALEKSKIESIH